MLRSASFVIAGAMTLSLAACNRAEAPATESAPAAAPAEDHSGHPAGTSRAFFVTPKNGDTIKPASKFEFGSEAITIAAIPPLPEGVTTVADADVRGNTGHYHLGLNADCVPAGETIPRGVMEWIHFGTGSNNIEMNLTPGQHKLSLQVGDDQHKAVAGLCETITVTVAP
jgi:hypothetical protein